MKPTFRQSQYLAGLLLAMIAVAVALCADSRLTGESRPPGVSLALGARLSATEAQAASLDLPVEAEELWNRAPVGSTSSSANQSAVLLVAGQAELSDGSLLSGMTLIAVSASSAAQAASRSTPGFLPSQILGTATTDQQGHFRLSMVPENTDPSGFVLYQTSHPHLGQNALVYEYREQLGLSHKIPGTKLLVQVLDELEQPVPQCKITAQCQAGAYPRTNAWTQEAWTAADGRAAFLVAEASDLCLRAIRAEDLAVSELTTVLADPAHAPQTVTLRLGRVGFSGVLQLSVQDRGGVPVDEFRARIASQAAQGAKRFVANATWPGTMRITALPLGPTTIELAPSFSSAPTFYDPGELETQTVELQAGVAAQITFVVDLQARIAFTLQGPAAGTRACAARIQRVSQGAEDWQELRRYWQFAAAGGATEYVQLGQPGTSYSDVLECGLIELEVRELSTGELLWQGAVDLRAGLAAPVLVSLN